MKAIVSVTLDNEFVIHDIKIIEGEKDLFMAMPSHKAVDGEYYDIVHPINSNTKDMIQTTILNKYEATPLGNRATMDGMAQDTDRIMNGNCFSDNGRLIGTAPVFMWKKPRNA